MPTRRDVLSSLGACAAGLALSVPLRAAFAATPAPAGALNTRAIPATGERLPVIGLGTSDSFEVGDGATEREPLCEVLRRFFAAGASIIDTAPSYGTAEAVVGELLAELGLRPRAFIATKIGAVGRDAGLAQFQRSLTRLKTGRVDLLQVHNLRDWRTQLALIEALKAEGKVRYSGLTHYTESGHDELAAAVRAGRPDFLQVNYSVIARGAETALFPLAQELGIAVLINRAFDDGRLFARARGKALPGWAAEAGIHSWAQAFLRFALTPAAVTAVIPATAKPQHLSDNLQAGVGAPLSEAQRRSLIELLA